MKATRSPVLVGTSADGHDHRSAAAAHRGRLVAVLALSLTILVVEVIGSVVANGLALLADAGHVLTDVVGMALALAAFGLGMNVVSAHLVIAEDAGPPRVLDAFCSWLYHDFDIGHSTFQLETADRRRLEEGSHA